MSYDYWVDACEFSIDKKHFRAIWEEMVRLDIHEANAIEHNKFNQPVDLRAFMVHVFRNMGFDILTDKTGGNIVEIQQTSERMDDVDEAFGVLAPFVEDGSYLKCRGEDGCLWRWRFTNGKCYSDDADIVYRTGDSSCPIHRVMGGKNVCATCPFGLVCLCEENSRLASVQCDKCSGEIIVDNVTDEILAGTTCTCHPRRFIARK